MIEIYSQYFADKIRFPGSKFACVYVSPNDRPAFEFQKEIRLLCETLNSVLKHDFSEVIPLRVKIHGITSLNLVNCGQSTQTLSLATDNVILLLKERIHNFLARFGKFSCIQCGRVSNHKISIDLLDNDTFLHGKLIVTKFLPSKTNFSELGIQRYIEGGKLVKISCAQDNFDHLECVLDSFNLPLSSADKLDDILKKNNDTSLYYIKSDNEKSEYLEKILSFSTCELSGVECDFDLHIGALFKRDLANLTIDSLGEKLLSILPKHNDQLFLEIGTLLRLVGICQRYGLGAFDLNKVIFSRGEAIKSQIACYEYFINKKSLLVLDGIFSVFKNCELINLFNLLRDNLKNQSILIFTQDQTLCEKCDCLELFSPIAVSDQEGEIEEIESIEIGVNDKLEKINPGSLFKVIGKVGSGKTQFLRKIYSEYKNILGASKVIFIDAQDAMKITNDTVLELSGVFEEIKNILTHIEPIRIESFDLSKTSHLEMIQNIRLANIKFQNVTLKQILTGNFDNLKNNFQLSNRVLNYLNIIDEFQFNNIDLNKQATDLHEEQRIVLYIMRFLWKKINIIKNKQTLILLDDPFLNLSKTTTKKFTHFFKKMTLYGNSIIYSQ